MMTKKKKKERLLPIFCSIAAQHNIINTGTWTQKVKPMCTNKFADYELTMKSHSFLNPVAATAIFFLPQSIHTGMI